MSKRNKRTPAPCPVPAPEGAGATPPGETPPADAPSIPVAALADGPLRRDYRCARCGAPLATRTSTSPKDTPTPYYEPETGRTFEWRIKRYFKPCANCGAVHPPANEGAGKVTGRVPVPFARGD